MLEAPRKQTEEPAVLLEDSTRLHQARSSLEVWAGLASQFSRVAGDHLGSQSQLIIVNGCRVCSN